MPYEMITFNDVHFTYSGEPRKVLEGSSFNVHKGDRMVFKGESGCGKTTLFRLILGFERPDRGEIVYENNLMDSNVVHQLRKASAWLPQDLNLGSGSVKEVMKVPFEFSANANFEPVTNNLEYIFDQLGLEHSLLESEFSELSTGQRQRVGIAICHLLDKPLILLDEPTSALDRSSKQKAIDLLFEDPERTIISTSHDPYWIERCDKVIELE